MDSDDFILELLGDSPSLLCSAVQAPQLYSATAVPAAAAAAAAAAALPTFRSCWSPMIAAESSTSDDLSSLNTWDFALMRSEFGDLQSFDSAALISLYQPAEAAPPAASPTGSWRFTDSSCDDDEDAAAAAAAAAAATLRCRSDSGYSESTVATSATAAAAATVAAYGGHCWSRLSSSGSDISCSPSPPAAAKLAPRRARARLTKSRQMQLWQFLYHLLQRPGSHQQLVDSAEPAPLRWENRQDGTFRIVNPTALADAWGAHRRRGNMTYEKMSRTLRYYYDRRLITKVAGKQHTYRFHYDQFPDL